MKCHEMRIKRRRKKTRIKTEQKKSVSKRQRQQDSKINGFYLLSSRAENNLHRFVHRYSANVTFRFCATVAAAVVPLFCQLDRLELELLHIDLSTQLSARVCSQWKIISASKHSNWIGNTEKCLTCSMENGRRKRHCAQEIEPNQTIYIYK